MSGPPSERSVHWCPFLLPVRSPPAFLFHSRVSRFLPLMLFNIARIGIAISNSGSHKSFLVTVPFPTSLFLSNARVSCFTFFFLFSFPLCALLLPFSVICVGLQNLRSWNCLSLSIEYSSYGRCKLIITGNP